MLFLKCEKYEIMPIKYTDVEVKWDNSNDEAVCCWVFFLSRFIRVQLKNTNVK